LRIANLVAQLKYRQGTLYRPYSKQAEFLAAGATHRERCLLAGNQVGKTLSAGQELYYHLSGCYPEWWIGKRFSRPTKWWASNTSNEAVRDNPQRILMGQGVEWGTGTIPRDLIVEKTMARGFPNLVDTVQVKHKNGGCSQLQFKAYEQGRKAWQGETLTGGIWFDEEPDDEIHAEGLARMAPGAISLFTVTPLLGMSKVVTHFYPHPDTEDRHITMMEIEDATSGPGKRGHYTPKEAAQRIASYPEHEREARRRGKPMLGEGAIYQIADSRIEEDALDRIPSHWPQINGLDFGWSHPFAAVNLVWDRDADVVHLTKTYRVRKETPPIHVAAVKPWGDWIRCAWPHDGMQTQKGDGVPLADTYRKAGLKMLPTHATFHTGGFHVEPGIIELLTRMKTGKFKVARHLKDWFAEKNSYHRKDGKIVKEQDDLLDATRAAVMSLRYARIHQARARQTTAGMDYMPLGA
jgi:phage terminase large subunit-like protein